MTDAQRHWLPLPFFAAMLLLWELAVRQSGQLTLVSLSERRGRRRRYARSATAACWRRRRAASIASCSASRSARLLGIPLGLLMGSLQPVNRAMSPIIDSLRSIAPIAWIPMALLWLGIRGNAALFIVAYAAFFPFVVNTMPGRAAGRSQPGQRGARARREPRADRSGGHPAGFAADDPHRRPHLAGLRLGRRSSPRSSRWASRSRPGGSGAVGLGQLMVSTLYIRRDVERPRSLHDRRSASSAC